MDIFEAIEANDGAKLRELLEQDPTVIDARDAKGATPLHWAAFAGRCELVQLLLDAGADINARDDRFEATPAGWAIEYLRERGGLLGIEIADAEVAIERGDVEWLERWIGRLPALKTARAGDGRNLAEIAQGTGNPALTKLFD